MATFTLRDLLLSRTPITAGPLTLSDFRNDGPTTVEPQFILIDTVEGAEPGLDIRLDPRVASATGPTQVGIVFEATSTAPILAGASLNLEGYSFVAPEAGGQAVAALTQGRRDIDNIGINVALDNAPGAPDSPSGTDDITGGPVPRFTFEYDFSLSAPGTVGVSEIRFDVVGGGGGVGGGLPPGFDGLQYIASHVDLVQVLGADAAAGEQHYLASGQAEGRALDTFNETQYLANYADLQAVFGGDTRAATAHYIQSGLAEGRTDDAPAFDGLQYIAGYGDLIQAFGTDAAAGEQHWVQSGQAEGRVADGFDEAQYLAKYPDLQAAFGGDGQAATVHYIQSGFAEGRTDDIFSV